MFNGTIVRVDITENTSADNTTKIGAAGLETTYGRFKSYEYRLRHNEPAFIIPVTYCAASVINDYRDVSTKGSSECLNRHANVKFAEHDCPYDDLTISYLVYIKVIDPNGIQKGKEILIDDGTGYGSDYL